MAVGPQHLEGSLGVVPEARKAPVDVDRRERSVPHSLRVLERRAVLEAVGG